MRPLASGGPRASTSPSCDLVAYWANGFDWRSAEQRLNRLPRFRTTVNGLGIHLIHARASAESPPAMPLLLAHGWPDSFWRYSEVVPLLVDPGRAR